MNLGGDHAFRKNEIPPAHLIIKSRNVDRVNEYKYLGFMMDSKLSGSSNKKLEMVQWVHCYYYTNQQKFFQ